MFYKGKGNHSVAQLEEIVELMLEKEHRINAPYAEGCLIKLENLKIQNLTYNDQDYYDLDFVINYFKGVLKVKQTK